MKKQKIIFLLSLFIVLFGQEAFARPHLTVRDWETGDVLLSVPVSYESSFTIGYIHSVDISPVFEVFAIDREKGIVLKETYFRMFGAGMGHWKGRGKIIQKNGWIRITEINEPLGGFILRVGAVGVDHTIIYGNERMNLSLKYAGKRVELAILHNRKSREEQTK